MEDVYRKTYTYAKRTCQNDGAYLATPRSYYENKFLVDMFPDTNLWIGINDIYWEGHFVSVDGHKVSYFRWSRSEPSNSNGNEDAVLIVGNNNHGLEKGKWNDAPVYSSYNFVCFRRI